MINKYNLSFRIKFSKLIYVLDKLRRKIKMKTKATLIKIKKIIKATIKTRRTTVRKSSKNPTEKADLNLALGTK